MSECLEHIRQLAFNVSVPERFKVRVDHLPSSVTLSVPGSKSFTNRALILAGMSRQSVVVQNSLFSADTYYGFECLEQLGFSLNFEGESVEISPPVHPPREAELFFGKAGTLARFVPAVVLNFERVHGVKLLAHATAEAQLAKRPLLDLLVALRNLGAHIEGDSFPITLKSSTLMGRTSISGSVSGQFLSGLLLAAAGAGSEIEIERTENLVQPDYVRMTLDSIKKFAGRVECNADLTYFRVLPSSLGCGRFAIEADASTACYFVAFAALHGCALQIDNIGAQTMQPDFGFVYVLEKMGVSTRVSAGSIAVEAQVQPMLRGGFSIDMSTMSDQVLTLAVMAVCADSPIRIFGVGHIRHHESDRLACLAKNLTRLGAHCEEDADSICVHPSRSAIAGEWLCYEDHRFAMAGFLLASRYPMVQLVDAGCVSKTVPDFFERCRGAFGVSLEEN